MIWSQKYRANGKFKRSFFVVILALELVILSRSFTAMTGIRNLRMCLHSFRMGSIFEMSLAITETIFKKNFHRDFREKFDKFHIFKIELRFYKTKQRQWSIYIEHLPLPLTHVCQYPFLFDFPPDWAKTIAVENWSHSFSLRYYFLERARFCDGNCPIPCVLVYDKYISKIQSRPTIFDCILSAAVSFFASLHIWRLLYYGTIDKGY